MTIHDSESVDLQAFLPGRFYFPPKDIYTEAVFVTRENIGALAIVFEASLQYDDYGDPYFRFTAQRGNDDDPQQPQSVVVFAGSWIFVIRQDLHVYKDVDFRNTFREIDLTNLLPEAQTEQQMRSTFEPQLQRQEDVFTLGQLVRVKSTGWAGRVVNIRLQEVRGEDVLVYDVSLPGGEEGPHWFEAQELENVDPRTDT